MNALTEPLPFSRRHFLQAASSGFGFLAFSALSTWAAEQDASTGASPLTPKKPHFKPRAKRVIFLCMKGGPSQLDTFDYKPELIKRNGSKETSRGRALLAPQWTFKQRGKSGLWISDLFPNLAQHADELCLMRSMQTDLPNHQPAFLQMHTGTSRFTLTVSGPSNFLSIDGTGVVGGKTVDKVTTGVGVFFPGISFGTSFTVQGVRFTGAPYNVQVAQTAKDIWLLDAATGNITNADLNLLNSLDAQGYPTVLTATPVLKKI